MSRYIDADKLRDNIDEWLDTVGYCTIGKELSYYGELIGCIKDTPTADVEKVKHGEWIKKNNVNYSPFDGSPEYIYICSECGREENKQEPYCNCGAKMDGGTK